MPKTQKTTEPFYEGKRRGRGRSSSGASAGVALAQEESVTASLSRLGHHQTAEEQIASLSQENLELRQILYSAAQLQRKLCSPRELRRGRFEVASELFPARHLSGDFYSILDMQENLGLAVGDIAGKGLVAGLWFTYFLGLVRLHMCWGQDPAACASEINSNLLQIGAEPPSAGLLLAGLNTLTGEVIYCNAGQPPVILLRKNGEVEYLREGGPILGAIPDAGFATGHVKLLPGDTLIAYSDGIIECCNEREEEFGVDRLLDAALKTKGAPASSVLFSVLGAAQDFASGTAQADDLTLMVIRHRERPAAA